LQEHLKGQTDRRREVAVQRASCSRAPTANCFAYGAAGWRWIVVTKLGDRTVHVDSALNRA
jgi:hypothetical protein